MTPPRALYDFGDFSLDVGQQRLQRQATGEAIPLTGKVFDTLVYLVEHAGELLDKDRLLRSIWPGVIVEENSLTQNISTLRQVLGETRGENRYIATIARKGYRFVAKVTRRDEIAVPSIEPVPAVPAAPAPTAPPVRTRKRIGLALGGVVALIAAIALIIFIPRESAKPVVVAGQTLAILPFKPLLPAERNESLELGMAESLISRLGRDSPGAISPLSSVRRYSALEQDAIAAGRALGVDTVLDGSLQRRGDRLRVSVRLLRVADGQQLWAENFDQDFTTIFDVQDAIATRVAEAMSMRWAETLPTRYTQDPEAYALYARGQFAWTRQTEASLTQAIGFFEQAIARDPNYALAYASLADSYAMLGVIGARAPHDVFPQAGRAVAKALSIDPGLAAAHAASGHIKGIYERDWEGAAREYARALQLDPSLAIAYHRRGLLYAMQGDIDRALASNERAQQLEPLWFAPKGAAGNFLYYARRYDESIRVVEQVLALDAGADNARAFLIRDLIVKGDYDRAIAEYDKRPLSMPGSYAHRAQALALSGRRGAALVELDRVLALSKQRYVAAYDIALIYTALGDTENAFLWLDHAVEDRSTLMNFLAQDPMLDMLHADPRFAVLVQRIGIYRRVLPELTADPATGGDSGASIRQ